MTWSGSSIKKAILGKVWGINNGSRQVRPLATGEAYCQPRERETKEVWARAAAVEELKGEQHPKVVVMGFGARSGYRKP